MPATTKVGLSALYRRMTVRNAPKRWENRESLCGQAFTARRWRIKARARWKPVLCGLASVMMRLPGRRTDL